MKFDDGQVGTKSIVNVVDDDGSVRTALTRLLRTAGYEVQPFASARDVPSSILHQRTIKICTKGQFPGWLLLATMAVIPGKQQGLAARAFVLRQRPCQNTNKTSW